jgi:hypothetical protein
MRGWKKSAMAFFVMGTAFSAATAGNIAPEAKASASGVYGNCSAGKVNDNSAEYPKCAWISQPGKGPQWVSLIWDKERKISAAKIIFPKDFKGFQAWDFKIQTLKKDGNPQNESDWLTEADVKENGSMTFEYKPAQGSLSARGVRVLVTTPTEHMAKGSAHPDHSMARVCEIEVEEAK